jgi:hypothetical protein
MLRPNLSSGAGTVVQLAADVPSGLSLTPPEETKQKVCLCMAYLMMLSVDQAA